MSADAGDEADFEQFVRSLDGLMYTPVERDGETLDRIDGVIRNGDGKVVATFIDCLVENRPYGA